LRLNAHEQVIQDFLKNKNTESCIFWIIYQESMLKTVSGKGGWLSGRAPLIELIFTSKLFDPNEQKNPHVKGIETRD
jgi:hypothetical protein